MEDNAATATEQEMEVALAARLKQATERKEPSTQAGPGTSGQQAAQAKSGTAWNSSDDFEEEPAQTAAANPAAPAEKPKPRVTEKAKRASARTATGMLDMTYRATFTPLINLKYKRKLKKFDPDVLEYVANEPKVTLTGKNLEIRDKWDKLMDARDKKLGQIPMDATEKQDTEELFYNYFDATDTTIPPSWGVVMVLASSLGKRAMLLATD